MIKINLFSYFYNGYVDMEIANKFELHYYLRDGAHQINALLRNKCEAELLAIVTEIAAILDVEAELIATAAREGGFRDFWDVIKGNANAITVVLMVAQLMLTLAPMLHKSEKEELEKELNRLLIEEAKLNIENLREEANGSSPAPEKAENISNNLSKNLRIIKRKSNFYSMLSQRSEVTKIGFAILDSDFVPRFAERQVERHDFRKHVLNSNKLKAEEVEAEIEIVSPVLKEGKYKWKGLYNGQPIGFDMLDLAFKDMVLLDSISFQHGSSILCVLRIERELDEVGDVKITGYAVTTVIEKVDGPLSVETIQGKKYRHAKKYIEGQGSLFI
ncbi:hypothetical protein NA647_02830 [Pseudomonas stutzeri]|uniref:hypothetical protein n=1 Tax=Stutzerimonas stutzeri TaxID=316 RepID=UPI00210A38A8|nr:hypothetical protein [Stutzerimonas stutzeri]MCQ4286370.1 hypothetical protein [Stutzerimonas stutzeri]